MYALRKDEKLRHSRLVDMLFDRGEKLYEYPLRMVMMRLDRKETEECFRAGIPPRVGNVQMLVTVPKRRLRHAVDRVLMRRRIREAYRLNRLPLKEAVEESGRMLFMAFIYLGDKPLPYDLIESKMRRLLDKARTALSSDVETARP